MSLDADLPADRLRRVVEEHIRVENEGRLDSTLDTLSDHCVFDSVPRDQQFHGREGASTLYAGLYQAFPDWHVELLSLTPGGENFLWAEAIATGTHQGDFEGILPTGRPIRLRMAVKFLVHGEKLGGEVLFFDRATLREQVLGTTPAPPAHPASP